MSVLWTTTTTAAVTFQCNNTTHHLTADMLLPPALIRIEVAALPGACSVSSGTCMFQGQVGTVPELQLAVDVAACLCILRSQSLGYSFRGQSGAKIQRGITRKMREGGTISLQQLQTKPLRHTNNRESSEGIEVSCSLALFSMAPRFMRQSP